MSLLHHILFITIVSVTNAANFTCPEQKPDPKFRLSSLPDKFKVSIEFVDSQNRFSADFVEFGSKDQNLSVVTCTNGSQRFDVIYDRNLKHLTFVNGTVYPEVCVVAQYSSGRPYSNSFFFPYDLLKIDHPVLGLYDLMKLLENASFSADATDHEEHDHGIPVDHFTGCLKSPDDKYWLEFKICLVKEGFNLNGINDPKLRLPTRLELAVYDLKPTKDAKSYFNAVYELFGYSTEFDDSDENFHLPPRGVFCTGRNNTKELPKLPETFSVSSEHLNHNNKHVDSSQLYYDMNESVIAVEFTRSNDFEPFTMGMVEKVPLGRYLAVQDFKSGVQYIVEPMSHRCAALSPIPRGAGTLEPAAGPDKRIMGMKDSFKLLFRQSPKDFFYVGTRYDDGIPMEVWNAKVVDTAVGSTGTTEYVYELWFSTESWDIDGKHMNVSNIPLYMKIYLQRAPKRAYSTEKFFNFKVYDKKQSIDHLMMYNVYECRETQALYMLQLNDTLENLKLFGIDNVAGHLKEIISNRTNVSQFRLGQFTFYADTPTKSVNFTFALAKIYDKEPVTKTNVFQTELAPNQAILKLNESIRRDQMAFEVQEASGKKLWLSVVKGSTLLVADPSAISADGGRVVVPSSVKRQGYSGGSMFTMALFMLLIGGVAGAFLAVVYFRRNRGGVAYQIYE